MLQGLLHLEIPAVGVLAMQGDGAAGGGDGHRGVEPVVALLQTLPADGDARQESGGLQLCAADSCYPRRRPGWMQVG